MQLSRPFQILLGAVLVLAAAWMFVIRPHNSQSSPSSAGPAAPGVNGLAHAVRQAHGAVALSQQNAAQLAAKSADASNPQGGHAAATGGTPGATASAASHAKPVFHPGAQPKAPGASASSHAAPANRSAEVTGPLAQGKVVVILFWDSRGADDHAVMRQLADVSRRNGKVVVLSAGASEVASFGSVTRGIQILETPTTLVINHRGQATTLTGLLDAATIEQAVVDAQRGAGSVQTPSLTAWTVTTRPQYVARANASCHTQVRDPQGSGSLKQQIAGFQRTVSVATGQVGALRAIPAPAADRAALGHWFALLERSSREMASAASAASGGHYAAARGLFFAGQADFDRASQGLADYGLSACFSAASLTS